MEASPNVRRVLRDDEFASIIANNNKLEESRLVVVFIYTPWCHYCKEMNPIYNRIAQKYPNTMFIAVNADKCITTKTALRVSGYPTFILYRGKTVVDRIEGKDPEALERKIRKFGGNLTNATPKVFTYQENQPSTSTAPPAAKSTLTSIVTSIPLTPQSVTNVSMYIDKSKCYCFNDLGASNFQAFLDGKKLTSGRGVGKLLSLYVFKQPLSLHYFTIKASKHSAPRTLKLYPNQPLTLDFDNLNSLTPIQEITLTEDDVLKENKINLFRMNHVTSLHILVPENMMGFRKIEIDAINIFGQPVAIANAAANLPPPSVKTLNR